MICLNTDRVTYERIALLLPDIWPGIRVNLVSMDDNLEKLGFCESAPCAITIDLSAEEHKALLDQLMDLEVDAYSTPDGRDPEEDDPKYIRYYKYGWMWDVLYHAEVRAE